MRTKGDGYLRDDGKFVLGTGAVLQGIHRESDDCREYGCVIHNPTDHPLREFKTHWRADRGIMERICKHGVGHIDPDDLAYRERAGILERTGGATHGCDGCCMSDEELRNIGMERPK